MKKCEDKNCTRNRCYVNRVSLFFLVIKVLAFFVVGAGVGVVSVLGLSLSVSVHCTAAGNHNCNIINKKRMKI